MFADAYEIASEYTFPVIISSIDTKGACKAAIGSFVIVNREGWALTAAHIFKECLSLQESCATVQDYESKKSKIEGDDSLTAKQKKAQLRKLKKPSAKASKASSVLWCVPHARVNPNVRTVPGIDLAVFKFEGIRLPDGFRPPELKDSTKPLRPGTSLARLGFPFHEITPTYDEAKDVFSLPPGALPIPRFPIEGIMTRTMNVSESGERGYPLEMIETSSPGLRGQSGGPIFDQRGVVWGIQSSTNHLPLGFSPTHQNREEHQFLNVGLGPSVATISGVLEELGVNYEVASY
jgi:hypothetical protein